MKYRNVVLFFIVGMLYQQLNAQDPNFSQFYNCPTYYNPAFTGYNDFFCLGKAWKTEYYNTFRTNYRKFKYDIDDNGFRTANISYDIGIIPKNMRKENSIGVGIITLDTKEGFYNTQSVGISLASGVLFSEDKKLRIGLLVNTIKKSITSLDLTFSSQLDAVMGKVDPYNRYTASTDIGWFKYYDVSFGSVFTYGLCRNSSYGEPVNNWIFGLSAHHIYNNASYTFNNKNERIPKRYIAQINYNKSICTGNKIYKYNRLSLASAFEHQDKFNTLTIGGNYYTYPVLFGFWARNIMVDKSDLSGIIEVGYDLFKPDLHKLLIKCVLDYDFCMSNRRYTYGDSIEFTMIIKYNYLYE